MLYIFVGVVNLMVDHELVRHGIFFFSEAAMGFLYSQFFYA
jgi:hypothetical protein